MPEYSPKRFGDPAAKGPWEQDELDPNYGYRQVKPEDAWKRGIGQWWTEPSMMAIGEPYSLRKQREAALASLTGRGPDIAGPSSTEYDRAMWDVQRRAGMLGSRAPNDSAARAQGAALASQARLRQQALDELGKTGAASRLAAGQDWNLQQGNLMEAIRQRNIERKYADTQARGKMEGQGFGTIISTFGGAFGGLGGALAQGAGAAMGGSNLWPYYGGGRGGQPNYAGQESPEDLYGWDYDPETGQRKWQKTKGLGTY